MVLRLELCLSSKSHTQGSKLEKLGLVPALVPRQSQRHNERMTELDENTEILTRGKKVDLTESPKNTDLRNRRLFEKHFLSKIQISR